MAYFPTHSTISGLARTTMIAVLLVLIAALALTLPVYLGVIRMNDSYWIDWVWLDQFARELGHGTLYPRWLSQSHHGLGSPVFYYYPPIAFYAASAFVLAGIAVYPSIIATFFLASALSGAAMYAWLKGQSKLPLFGALLYMAAPYHLFDFYMRGALAEYLAIAVLPLTMLGLRRNFDGRISGILLTALSYAALISTHLPLALLSSVFLIAPYALIRSRCRLASLAPAGASLLVGIGIASIYLVPAFLLEPYRDTANLWLQPNLQPQNWTIWQWSIVDRSIMIDILLISMSLVLPLVMIIVRQKSGWAVLGLTCTLLAIGLVPLLWTAPLLKSVQFPFRLLPVADFAFATAIARLRWRQVPLVFSLLPVTLSLLFATAEPQPGAASIEQLRTYHPDVPENLPPGTRPYSWPSIWALHIAAGHARVEAANGVTIVPRFYFPAWQIRCSGREIASFPDRRTQLLSHRGSDCRVTFQQTSAERIGGALSVLSILLLLLGTALVLRRQMQRSGIRPGRLVFP